MANNLVGDPRSNGAAENAIRQVRDMYHTHKVDEEDKLGKKVSHNQGMEKRWVERADEGGSSPASTGRASWSGTREGGACST